MERESSLSVILKRLADGWIHTTTAVYALNDSQLCPIFWDEIRSIRGKLDSLWIIGRDFNINRFSHERREADRHSRDRERFNDVISQVRLINLPLNNWLYTWSDMRENLNLARLDRVLICDLWDEKFRLADLRPLERVTLDHLPIYVQSGKNQFLRRRFHFEKLWLEHKEVYDIIRESWAHQTSAGDDTENFCAKLRCLHKVL